MVGIKCEFNGCRPLFILSVYLPASNHSIEDYRECLDFLWALYDSLSSSGFVIVMGDLNGDLGSSLGDKGTKEPNDRGLLLCDFANFFNLSLVNLLSTCNGPWSLISRIAGDIALQLITFCYLYVWRVKLLNPKHLS